MVDKDKVIKMLGGGLSPAVVAGTVGCDPSYISQLMAQDDIALEVAKLRCAKVDKITDRDEKYDDLEDKLLARLEDILPFMMKPRDVIESIKAINGAKRRGADPLTGRIGEVNGGTIINLTLPAITLQQFTLNEKNEVVQVGSRALVNIPAQALMKSLEGRGTIDAQKIPATTEQSKIPRISSKQAERAIIDENSV